MRFLPIIIISVFIFCAGLSAQNLEKIGKKDMVTIGGSMNLNSVCYDAFGMNPRRDPFTWYFSGSLNITVLDVSLPFTYSYSNQHSSYTQPFNMQSCSPKYKWAQVFLGTTSLSYSPYTLSGHIFTGAGIELRPGGFCIAAMYGRFNKAVEDNPLSGDEIPAFRRTGYAFKAGFEKPGHTFTFSWFHAADDLHSLEFAPMIPGLHPMENTCTSFNGKATLWKHVAVQADVAASGITRDLNAGSETTSYTGWQKWLLKTKTTSEFFRAWKFSVTYTAKNFSIAAIQEHVDPGYETFGAYYFTNDLQNWTLAPAARLMKGRLNIGANTGFQRNNLNGDRLSTTQRWVGSANISFAPSKQWTLNAAYSNFTSYTRNRPQADPFWTPSPADTLSFYQVAQQGSGVASYRFGERNVQNSIAVITSYQVTGQQQSGSVLPDVKIANANLTYTVQWIQTRLSFTVLGNFNQSSGAGISTQQMGPGVQIGKTFLKNRLRFSGGGVYNRSVVNNVLANHIVSCRSQVSYSPKVHHEKAGHPSFSMNAVYVSKLPVLAGLASTGELTVTVNAAYGF